MKKLMAVMGDKKKLRSVFISIIYSSLSSLSILLINQLPWHKINYQTNKPPILIFNITNTLKSNRHLHLNPLMRPVILHLEMPKLKLINPLYTRVHFQRRKRIRLHLVNILQALNVVLVHVHVRHHMHQLTPTQTSYLGNHACEKRVTGNVKWYSKTHVATSLVQNATQAVVVGYVELRQ